MATKRVIEDKDFGKIVIRTHKLAKNITMRMKNGELHVTTPPYSLTSKVIQVVNQFRESLLERWKFVEDSTIKHDYSISAPCFNLTLEKGHQKYFSIKHKDEKCVLLYPDNIDLSAKEVQKLIKNAIIRAMKKRASEYLPPLIDELSQTNNLPYKSVRISSSKGRWGSCSATKRINLSCFLMLLPPHLMDYVILHELAHTIEMNHGPRFWELLNKLTGEKAQKLRKELRMFSIKEFL